MNKLLILFLSSVAWSAQAQDLTDLQCEYLHHPLGIDVPAPRFTWKMNSLRQGASQQTARIWVDTDSLEVAQGHGSVWDSGEKPLTVNLMEYGAKNLKPFTTYYWKVMSRDEQGTEYHSPVARFETGMMQTANWQGTWISDAHDTDFHPVPYFRRAFSAPKAIRSARAYVAAAGLYEFYINGNKVGNHRLDPMYTRFDRRTLYVTYDVTSCLNKGENVLGMVLGNGWYNHQPKAVWKFDQATWRNRPRFCMDLRIEYEDGTQQVITTDRQWKTSTGALIYSNLYTGEHYDATRENKDWAMPGFNDKSWKNVQVKQAPAPLIISQQLHPIRAVEELKAVQINRLNDTTYVYDFGKNIAGVTRLSIQGWKNGRMRLQHAERLKADGHVDMSNIDVYYRGDRQHEPFQADIVYLQKGKRTQFMPKFNYKGFRYVEVVTNAPVEMNADHLKAFWMHSDVPQVGQITSSSDLLNKIWQAGRSSYISNLYGLPTDCPQREKNGWTGDGHFAIETGLYNYDAITIYEKWLADHRDEQQPNGVLPDIIPTWNWGYGTDNGTDWTSTIALIPWNIYLFYGDSRLLHLCYDNIRRYVDYVHRGSHNYLTTFGRGDWVPVKSRSNKELTCSVYFYVDAVILAKAARLFGYTDDAARYTRLAEHIRQAINDKYLDRQKGIYASGTQTELSVPLYWGVVPDDCRQKVAQVLAGKIIQNDYHLDVGVLGTKAILNALSENGHQEVAYRLALQDTYPSWGWWIRNGATTFLENWDLKATRDISDNHIMFSEVVAWFHKGLGGIYPDESAPGFKHIQLRPYFPKDLKQFTASHVSPYGQIISSWTRKGRKIEYKVVIPPNSTASLWLPKGIRHESGSKSLSAGTYNFTFRD